MSYEALPLWMKGEKSTSVTRQIKALYSMRTKQMPQARGRIQKEGQVFELAQ
jgi:hypothetical protein